MSQGVNIQIALGNLAADNELVHVGEKNTPKMSFRLIVNTGFGEHQHTEGFDVIVWGKAAENLHPYLTKGKRVFVQGETRTRSWDDDSGTTRYRTELVVSPYGGSIKLQGGNGNERQVEEADAAGEEPTDEIPF